MKMKPILFNTDMVRAILEGRKTVTRRAVKPQPFAVKQDENAPCWCGHFVSENGKVQVDKPPYRPGDILYVREVFFEHKDHFYYKADGKHEALAKLGITFKWHPSIHMPREAARIFLRVEDVRVEKLQSILPEDGCLGPSNIQKEGVNKPCTLCIHPDFDCREHIKSWTCDLVSEFVNLWDRTIKPAERAIYGWDANPWVWVIEFLRISREEAEQNAKVKN